MADDKNTTPRPPAGTDATTGAEQGIGSGVGTGWDGTIAGSIDGSGNSYGTGVNTVGAGFESSTGIQTNPQEQFTPGLKDDRQMEVSDTIDIVGGVGIPPRAADGSIDRDYKGTVDADRVRATHVVTGPDIGGIPDELLHDKAENERPKKD